jgi:serine/threonine protein kinase
MERAMGDERTTIGKYEIVSELGRGGMGVVFKAWEESLQRFVAIKMLGDQLTNDENLVARFLREARAVADLNHPNIVQVFSVDKHEGRPYFAMEFVEGESLTELIRTSNKIEPSRALTLLKEVANGMSAAHDKGVVHRDIKPDNIMLTPAHRVVLMDFGLVLPEFDVNGQQRVAGSPPYMAPEALLNTAAPGSGHLVDIFGLGVVAYELLAGVRPYAGMTIREVVASHERGQPTPLAEVREDCPPTLCQVVHEMLSSNPQLRVQSAEGAAWQLRGALGAQPQGERTPANDRKPLSVLIVDDDVDLAKILSFYVRQILGKVDVRVAHDGEHAIAEVKRDEPDVMLLDLHMPRMNGVEVCMQMKGEGLGESCSIISVSAGAQETDVQLLHQLGIHHFLEKGSSLRERLRTVFSEVCGDGALAAE